MPVMNTRSSLSVSIIALLLILLTAGCTGTSPASAPSQQTVTAGAATTVSATQTVAAGTFSLHVDSVADGGTLPAAYTCTASMPASPPISWENVPAGTKTLTLIVEDPDAPSGTYTHWIVYNIPPARKSIPGGITAVKEIDGGGQQGDNTAGDHMYGAACPPIGSSHRYRFTLYAVDYSMGLPTTDREGINTMLNDHTIGQVTVTAHFSR